MKAIQTTELCRSFGDVRAVDHLDLSVESGEIYALLGVNGAGKTTTIRMLSCLLPPDSGDALLMGHSILRESAAVKQIINLSPQETAVARNLTARENLLLIAQIYGFSMSEAAARADELVDALELHDVVSRRAGTLSGGYQRRLSIAMALVSHPQILFLDEPTLGLDVLARRALWSFIETLRGKMTMILTTHAMDEAEALSDRIGVLANGRLRACGTAQELKTLAQADSLEDAFVKLVSKEASR
ncbi:MAG: ATP-binding cassette domain-containing protein [Clostridia bacterium]|nr:ATP-binding cassette domain-containing protein [Clostridia bacterium]